MREYSWAEMTNAMLENITSSLEHEKNELKTDLSKDKKEDGETTLCVRAFGSFQVFYNDVPLRFKYERSREMFAYLIDRNGSFCTKTDLWKELN